MRDLLKLLPLVILFILVFIYREPITEYIVEKIIFSKEIYIEEPNQYALDYDFEYIKTTDDFIADNRQEILNIIYTSLNNGYDNFYFYCHYEECQEDVSDITEPENLITISNYIHPYNAYRRVYVSTNSFDKVEIRIEKSYTKDNINSINQKLDQIIKEIITDDMSDKEKITVFHNYIIDNTVYDSNYLETNLNDIDNPSHKALGPLFFGKALCGGYADVMAIFLDRLNIPNYRISSSDHIWNFVYLDNNWYHLDLTWDDPVTDSGVNMRLDTFLLITTEQLENLNTNYHIYDKNIYPEAK
mgnify:FL=1